MIVPIMMKRSLVKMTVALAFFVLSLSSVAARPGVRTSSVENSLQIPLGYKRKGTRRRSHIKVVPAAAVGHTTTTTTSATGDTDTGEHLATVKLHAKHERRQKQKEFFLVFGLGTLAGISDVISSRYYGYYSNMMTGNFIRCAVALAEGNVKAIFFFTCLISAYAVGVAIFRAHGILQQQHDAGARQQAHNNKRCPSLAQVSLVTFAAADLLYGFVSSCVDGVVSKQWRLPLLAIGFGLVNAASMNGAPGQVTNACTGHLTRITCWMVDLVDTYLQKKLEATQYMSEYHTHDTATTTTTTTLLTPTTESPKKKTSPGSSFHQVSLSFSFLLSFVSAVVVSAYFCNQMTSPASMTTTMIKTVSSMTQFVQILASAPGTCFGVLYYVLFCWYHGR